MYKVIIGLEVHCELKTNSKNFSSAKNTYTNLPNVNVMPVDLGLPGILPVVNKEACRKALKTAMALNCTTPDEIIFDRKNYYYPDLPKGYQITQVTKPFGRNGHVTFFVNGEEKTVDIHQLHLEEDTASLEHCSNYSLIDYNRSGIPLMEIVTEPCIYSADEAVRFLETLRNIFLYNEVSEAKSDKGQMRCDVNISLMKDTDTEFGTKVEMKNINAFTSVKAAIEYEIKRQTEILERGEKVIQETRRIDEDGKTYSMREKVDAVDYKYYIEPNLAPVKLTLEFKEEVRSEIPELEYSRVKRYLELGLSISDAETIARNKDISNYFDELLNNTSDISTATNWMTIIILGSLNKLNIDIKDLFITPKMLGSLVDKVSDKELSSQLAKNILYEAMEKNIDPMEIIEKSNIKQISNEDELISIIKDILNENKEQVSEYLNGNEKVANFLVGRVMQKTNKQANPGTSLKLIKEELERMR